MKKILFWIFFIALLSLSVYFTSSNFTHVSFNYLLGSSSIPLALLLYVTLLAGIIIGLLLNLNILLKYRRENRQLKKETESSRSELTKLRGIPYKDLS